jgi:4-aminobutyrate aminotransferase-like enzyme
MSLNTFLQALRIFNTWIGDPSKVILLEAVVKVIKQQNLLSQVNEVGKSKHGRVMVDKC